MPLSLYPHPDPPTHPIRVDPDLRGFFDVAELLVDPWLERFEGFDYGAMTVWLMRGFGLPNLRTYDADKHGSSWGLDTGEGYVITVEPGLVRIDPEEWRTAGEEREGSRLSRKEMRMSMLAHGVLGVWCVDPHAKPLNNSMIEGWLDEFARPIYIRDMGAGILGPLAPQECLGPGDPRRISNDQEDAPPSAPPKANPSRP